MTRDRARTNLGRAGMLLLAIWALSARAQAPLDDLLFTVGTTTVDTNGQYWSYVLLGSPQPQLIGGKKFAIYGKNDFPTNVGTFTLRGTVFPQTDSTAINNLLNQSLSLGEDLAGLSDALNLFLHSTVVGISNLTLPQKIVAGSQVASANPATAQTLGLLARTHPGLLLCLGQAFAEQVVTVTTYEVREVNPAGAAGDVVGRVTVVPGSPIILPGPGAPFQVVSNGATDHLRVRLRWGTPDPLRRLSLLTQGYNVWRTPRTNAEALGWDVTPPTTSQLYGNPLATRANASIVTASKNFPATGANDPSDPTTVFFSDNNGRAFGSVHFQTNGPPLSGYLLPPFNDGDEFYYFVTARDILGRDGLVSPGGLARACRKVPPLAPTDVRVSNSVTNTNQSRLLITWQQNANAGDAVTEYWVYRWPNPSMALTNDIAPASNRIGTVTQIAGPNNSFLDTGGDAPVAPGASNFWYTVRAVSHSACAEDLLSPHSGTAWGVLRQRVAPLAATGKVFGSCGTPVVAFQGFNMLTNDNGPDTLNWNYRFTVQRRDPGIAWVQFSVTNLGNPLSPIYFDPESDTLSFDYSVPTTSGQNFSNDVTCTVGTFYGQVSAPAVAHFTASLYSTQRQEAVFLAGQLLETALTSSDPLLLALSPQGPTCVPATSVVPKASGTVRLSFNIAPGTPVMVQVLESNTWSSLGIHLADSNNFYWVSYPACLTGPSRSFQGCILNLPNGSGDCFQHVARASASGPVAPIRVQFGLTPGTQEYRLYRSVNDGPLTMIAQGAAPYDTNTPNQQVVRTDDGMPPSMARLCYFVQLLDENGNGSAMSFLGCKDNPPIPPPRPVLAEPQPGSDTNTPQVVLNWFCPTSGVYRFQVMVARADDQDSPSTGLTNRVLSRRIDYNPSTLYAGLSQHRLGQSVTTGIRQSLTHFGEVFWTPPLGPNFGPGPQFSLTNDVLPGVPYRISVSALMDQSATNFGPASQVWQFTWNPPPPVDVVPWPARPLPLVKTNFDDNPPTYPGFITRVTALLLYDDSGLLDSRHPVGVRIGDFGPIYQPTSNIGNTNYTSYTTFQNNPGFEVGANPNDLLFRRLANDPTRREPLLPIVVYRQQVTNTAFPRVSGHLTQVTPLLETLPYSSQAGNGYSMITVRDKLIASGRGPIAQGIDTFGEYLYLRDQQPVALGASYQYWVVRMTDKREVAEIINAGIVTLPGP